MNIKAEAFPITFTDEILGPVIGCDMRVLHPQATVYDALLALDSFAAEILADCQGCDGCCRERAPLTALDIESLASLIPPSPWPAHAVCAAFADIHIDRKGATDITLKRGADSACCNLDTQNKTCRVWPQRGFVCRSHFCLPRSDRISQLREEVVNAGENELTRLLLAEEATGAAALTGRPLAELLDPADYPPGPLTGCTRPEQARLADILSPELWARLLE